MTTDRDPTAEQEDAAAWLDGLAGRHAESPAAHEGAGLRAALLPVAVDDAGAAPPPWQQIVARARQPAPPAAAGAIDRPVPAANDARWRRRAPAMAAALGAVIAGAGLWHAAAVREAPESALRGAPSAEGAVWRVSDPVAAAQALAEELRAAGARVTVTAAAQGAELDIACAATACAAVDARLQGLDAAMDGARRLRLRVLPPR